MLVRYACLKRVQVTWQIEYQARNYFHRTKLVHLDAPEIPVAPEAATLDPVAGRWQARARKWITAMEIAQTLQVDVLRLARECNRARPPFGTDPSSFRPFLTSVSLRLGFVDSCRNAFSASLSAVRSRIDVAPESRTPVCWTRLVVDFSSIEYDF